MLARRILSLGPFLLLFAASIFMLGTNPFKGETLAPMDVLLAQEGFQNIEIDLQLTHPERSDVLDAKLPRWRYLKQAIRAGHFPLWNPNTVHGMPAIQYLPASVFSPAFVAFLIVDNDALGFYLASMVNVLIAAFGTYLLLYHFFSNRAAALLGALVFTFAGFNIAWFYWQHVNTSIWIPWLLFFTARYLDTRQARHLPLITLTSALMILGGFPIVAVYGFFTFAIMTAVYLVPDWRQPRQMIRAGVPPMLAVTLAFGIAALVIQPLQELLSLARAMEHRYGGTVLTLGDAVRFIDPNQEAYPSVEKTVYLGILPVVLVPAALLMMARQGLNKPAVLGIGVMTISIIYLFGLAPHDLLRSVPAIGNDPWQRTSILVALGAAILSAYAVSRLESHLLKKGLPSYVVFGIVSALLVVQFFDQRELFREFNRPVPREAFLPSTETLRYIQNNLAPLQGALASSAFLTSGVVGNYGIPEWHAHGFKTRRERSLLEQTVANPFATSTASIFDCPQVRFSSPEITLLGMRYIVCQGIQGNKLTRLTMEVNAPTQQPSPLLRHDVALIQHFGLRKSVDVDEVALYVTTHGAEHAASDVRIRLFHDDTLLGEGVAKKSSMGDNQWVHFRLPQGISVPTENNRLEISLAEGDSDVKLSVWMIPEKLDRAHVSQGDLHLDGVFVTRFFQTTRFSSKEQYQVHDLEKGISVIENTHVTGSGYFLKTLSREEHPDFRTITLEHYEPERIELTYNGAEPGWLVLPMRYYPGWQAYNNGATVTTEAFLGIMPAIAVNPGDRIGYRYEPRSLYIAGWISILSLIIWFALTMVFLTPPRMTGLHRWVQRIASGKT